MKWKGERMKITWILENFIFLGDKKFIKLSNNNNFDNRFINLIMRNYFK